VGAYPNVSIACNEAIKHLQYLGDDGEVGEVGEVGEYFGEARVISAGARWRISKAICHSKPISNTHKLRNQGIDKRRLVTTKFSYLENLLGESKTFPVRQCDNSEQIVLTARRCWTE
jgi:hypothetical protein